MSTTWNDTRFGPGSYEHSAQEDRSAPRHRVVIAAKLRASGHCSSASDVLDIGLGGFTATYPEQIPPGTACWLSIPGIAVTKAEVVWCEAGLLGAAFARLLDRDEFDTCLALPGTDQVG